MGGTPVLPGVETRAHTALGRSEGNEFVLTRGNRSGTGRMWNYFNILSIMTVRWMSLQRRTRTREGHNGRRQKEGHLPWGILGTRVTLRKRQPCPWRGKQLLGDGLELKPNQNRWRGRPCLCRLKQFKCLREVGCKGTGQRFPLLFTEELWVPKS